MEYRCFNSRIDIRSRERASGASLRKAPYCDRRKRLFRSRVFQISMFRGSILEVESVRAERAKPLIIKIVSGYFGVE
jgi:hypothetical protein